MCITKGLAPVHWGQPRSSAGEVLQSAPKCSVSSSYGAAPPSGSQSGEVRRHPLRVVLNPRVWKHPRIRSDTVCPHGAERRVGKGADLA